MFKLRSTINEKNEEQWKRNRSYGVKNKVLRNAVEILEGKDVLDFEELKDQILKRIPDAEPNLRYRTRKILLDYSCKDEKDPESENALFFFEDSSNQIKLNQKVMDLGLYDLDRIGLIDKKPPYYQKLLAKAVEMLKESKDNKCLLNEIQENCKALIPAEYSLAPFYKLFNADVLKNYSTEIERKEDTNGIIWLSLKEENLQSASFKAKESVETNVEEIAPQLVSVSRPEAEPLLDVNWDTLLSSMRTELSYYGKSIWNLNSSWDNALMKLVEFLRNSQNSLLRERIPRDMITLWNYKIDKYDLYNFLAHLSTSFEALIREIYQKNEGQTPRNTSGLFDTMSLMAETEEWSKVMGDRTCTGFDRILRDLRFRRNDICHGVDVELSTLQMSQTVNNYIALYVYTVANFYRE